MTSRIRIITAAAIVAVLAVAAVSTASAATMRAQVDGMIVIGDQVFEGGEIQIAPVSDSLLAVRIDGRQIALAHRPDRSRDAASPVLTFARDARGYYHLRGIRYASQNDAADGSAVRFQFTAIESGDASAVVLAARTRR